MEVKELLALDLEVERTHLLERAVCAQNLQQWLDLLKACRSHRAHRRRIGRSAAAPLAVDWPRPVPPPAEAACLYGCAKVPPEQLLRPSCALVRENY